MGKGQVHRVLSLLRGLLTKWKEAGVILGEHCEVAVAVIETLCLCGYEMKLLAMLASRNLRLGTRCYT